MSARRAIAAAAALAAVIAVGLAAAALLERRGSPPSSTEAAGSAASGSAPSATATYRCTGGRTIRAAFYAGSGGGPSGPGAAPSPAGSVRVDLGGGRRATLQRTLSADGLRYSDGDPAAEGEESVVFWSRGNGALLLEPDAREGPTRCIRTADDPGGLPEIFVGDSASFSIRYPAGWAVDSTYRYRALGPGRSIAGVAFTVPGRLARGTNLSPDTRLTVEELPVDGECSADDFLAKGAGVTVDTLDGTAYSLGRLSDAGAGNRYRETVFALPGTRPCLAVRYFLHWTVLENYPPGAVAAFHEDSLIGRFDAMRRTLAVAP
ncbi:MAG TPA: MliC family protein [Gemmatimonadota bacterium]|nr:MliC family protein [Gemmatimonadota bacterium]